jgi:hypothetical protein
MLARIKVKENPVVKRNLCVCLVIVALCCAYCASRIRVERSNGGHLARVCSDYPCDAA